MTFYTLLLQRVGFLDGGTRRVKVYNLLFAKTGNNMVDYCMMTRGN